MFITLFGGLAFFLYGMKLLSDSLKKTAGGRLEKLLNKATDNQFKGLTIGAVITIAIQSSSAMTVMLVGFVNSGIMSLEQTVGVCFGAFMGIFPGFTASQFGSRNNSVNYGIMFIGFALAGILGPMIMNAIKSGTGNYQGAFLVAAALGIVGEILIALLAGMHLDRDFAGEVDPQQMIHLNYLIGSDLPGKINLRCHLSPSFIILFFTTDRS